MYLFIANDSALSRFFPGIELNRMLVNSRIFALIWPLFSGIITLRKSARVCRSVPSFFMNGFDLCDVYLLVT